MPIEVVEEVGGGVGVYASATDLTPEEKEEKLKAKIKELLALCAE